jgi:hypothetical protein
MLRLRYGGRGRELPCPLGTLQSRDLQVLTIQKLSEPRPFGLLWRLHYTGMMTETLATGDTLYFWLPSPLQGGAVLSWTCL